MDVLNKAADKISYDLELALHELELQSRDLEDQKQVYEDQIKELQRQSDLLQRQIDLLEESKEPIQAQIDALNTLIDGQQDAKDQIQEQIDLLNESKKVYEDQLDVLNRQLDAIGRNEEDIQHSNELLDRQISAVTTGFQLQIDAINHWREVEIANTNATADAERLALQTFFEPLLAGVANALGGSFVATRDKVYQSLLDLTSGTGTAAWLNALLTNTRDYMNAIFVYLSQLLAGDLAHAIEATPVPAATGVEGALLRLDTTLTHLDLTITDLASKIGGGAAGGNFRVADTGLMTIHKDEVIIPMPFAETYRQQGGWMGQSTSGGGSVITIAPGAVQVNGVQDPQAVSSEVIKGLERELRSGGRFRAIISKIPRG